MNQQAVSWAAQRWGRAVVTAEALRGGWTSDILMLTAEGGERAVLRLMVRDPWRTHAEGLLTRESEIQEQLVSSAVPAPHSIALDTSGARAGVPAHLMSWLPGRLDLTRDDDVFLQRLAGLLQAVHRHDPGDRRPRTYQSWAHEAKRVIPHWTDRPHLWRAAFELLEQEPPAHRGVFLHRDFHLGNVLWDGDEPSGVVDWVETSWGPAALDVAHCSTYLAMLHGLEAAQRFREAYGEFDDPDAVRYWSVMDIVGYLPGPAKVIEPWRALGHDVAEVEAQHRLEELLRVTLGG